MKNLPKACKFCGCVPIPREHPDFDCYFVQDHFCNIWACSKISIDDAIEKWNATMFDDSFDSEALHKLTGGIK